MALLAACASLVTGNGGAEPPDGSAASDAGPAAPTDAPTPKDAPTPRNTADAVDAPPEMLLAPIERATLAVGEAHLCVLSAAGAVRCMGRNDNGALGDGTHEFHDDLVAVPGLTDVVHLAAGYDATYALRADGSVVAWGANARGQLGDGTQTERPSPIALEGLNGVVDLNAGYRRACAVRSDGSVWCWGRAPDDRFGMNPVDRIALRPTRIDGVTGATRVAVGTRFTCVLMGDGTARCWGLNSYNNLGSAGSFSLDEVVRVTGVEGGIAIGAGEFHACALVRGGAVRCWGLGLGVGTGVETATSGPVEAPEVFDAVQLTVGMHHTCVLRAPGVVQCWGYRQGDPSRMRWVAPGLPALQNAVSVASGGNSSCARARDGTISCWGLVWGMSFWFDPRRVASE